MSIKLDSLDRKILSLLQRDASISTASIAEQINVSQSPCWRRINRLEEAGLIKGRVALLDRAALGMEVVVFSTINLTSTGRQNLIEFERDIVQYPEVACFHCSRQHSKINTGFGAKGAASYTHP